MLTVAFCGQKGGVGKSTAAVCLACEWMERGLSVLLVDADPQGTATTWASVRTEAGRKTPTLVAMREAMHKNDQLSRVSAGFDRVVIDCPARMDKIQRSALMVADV